MAPRQCGKQIQTGENKGRRCVLSAGHGGKCRSVVPGSKPSAVGVTAPAHEVDLDGQWQGHWNADPTKGADGDLAPHLQNEADFEAEMRSLVEAEPPHLSAATAATQTAARGGWGDEDTLGVPETAAGRSRAALSDRTGPAVLHQIALHHGDDPQIMGYVSDNESAAGETLALIAEKATEVERLGLWTRAFPRLAFNHNTYTETLNFMGESLLDDKERSRGGTRQKDAFEKTLSGLATHENTEKEMLLRIEGSRVNRYIRELAVEHPHFPAERLAELAKKSRSPVILRLVASHGNTPPRVLGEIALSKKLINVDVKATAVRNPFIETASLEKVIAEGDPTMLGAVADNISTPKKDLVDILNGSAGQGPSCRAAANLSTPEEALDAALNKGVRADPDSHEWLLVGEMARNPALTRKQADKMIDTQHGIAMSRLAKEPATHPEIVARIRVEAESKAVRYDALCTLEVQAGRPDPSKNHYGNIGKYPPRWAEA